MSSPSSVLHRLSEEATGLDEWMMKTTDKDYSVHGLSLLEVLRVKNKLESAKVKFRIRFDGERLRVSHPSTIHEAASGFFDSNIVVWNLHVGGNFNTPLESLRSADLQLLNGGLYEPDSSFQVRGRFHPSPNAILEVDYHSGLTITQFTADLKTYIERTPDVMLSMGVKLYDRLANGSFAALFVAYQRDVITNSAEILHLISFGTANLHHAALTAWRTLTVHNVSGVVPGGVACLNPPDDIFLPRLPHAHLVCIDNVGLHLGANALLPGVAAGADFVVNLFDLQQTVDNYLPFQ
jgi:hypothetical protein